jgi:hypothetical protein
MYEFHYKMTEFLPTEDKVLEIIKRWSNPPTKKIKTKSENYDRILKVLYGHHPDFEKWLKDPELKKQMEMNVGYFIQDLIGNMKDHINYEQGHETGLDGENNIKNPVKYEVKVDERTTNSSSLDECINKLKRATEGTSTKPLLIQFFREKMPTLRSKYSDIQITGESYINNYISMDVGGVNGLITYLERTSYVHEIIEEILQRVVLSHQ